MGDSGGTYRVLVKRSEGRKLLGRLDGRIILIRSFEKWDGEAWAGLIWLRIGTGCGRL